MSRADAGNGGGGDLGTVDRHRVPSLDLETGSAQRGQAHRDAMNAVFADGDSLVAATQRATTTVPATPFTLVIEIDAWNLRERDGWGQTAALTQAGQPPSRGHGVYSATVFRLDQRAQTAGGRPVISERGYEMTRGGMGAVLRAVLWGRGAAAGVSAVRARVGHGRWGGLDWESGGGSV